MSSRNPITKGEILFNQYGEKGIRREAQEGFPSIKNISFSFLKELYLKSSDKNAANINVLLSLMEVVNDTNVLGRSNYQPWWVCRSFG